MIVVIMTQTTRALIDGNDAGPSKVARWRMFCVGTPVPSNNAADQQLCLIQKDAYTTIDSDGSVTVDRMRGSPL